MANRSPWIAKPPLGSQVNRSHPLAQALSLLYLFNEGGGMRLRNLGSTSSADAILAGSSTRSWIAGRTGMALQQSGTSSGAAGGTLSMANAPSTTTYSIEVILRRDTPINGYNLIIDQNSSAAGLYVRSSNNVSWYQAGDNQSVTMLTIGSWYQIVLVAVGVNYSMYINGILDSTGTSGSIANLTSFDTIIDNNSSQALAGVLDKLAIYSRALSATEVRQLYVQPFAMIQAPRRRNMTAAALSGTKEEFAYVF